ncbi:hypothetical protein Aperf_G00000121180 [Anoplocephala perfoliata]
MLLRASSTSLGKDGRILLPLNYVRLQEPGGSDFPPGVLDLKVNGYCLRGRSHVEVVRCLRSLPSHIELVVARSLPNAGDQDVNGDISEEIASGSLDETGNMLHVAASEIGSTATGAFPDDLSDGRASSWAGDSPYTLPSHPSTSKVSEWIRGSQPDMTGTLMRGQGLIYPSPTAAVSTAGSISNAYMPASMLLGDENISYRPEWSSVPLIVMLRRDKPSFGFSISSYDEPSPDGSNTIRRGSTLKRTLSLRRPSTVAGDMANRSGGGGHYATMGRSSSLSTDNRPRHRNTLIIVNEIVPGGCVDQDGRIKTGDRLLFVNDKKLTHASIGEAANALTNAPLGYTMLGVSKMYLVPNTTPPLLNSHSSPQFTAAENTNPDVSPTLQAMGLLVNPTPCMVAGCYDVSFMRYHTFCYRSAVTSKDNNKHLWGGREVSTLPSSRHLLLARQLVDDVFDYVEAIASFVDDVVADALVEVLQRSSEEGAPCKECFEEEIPAPERIEASAACLDVDTYFASQNVVMPVTLEITGPVELMTSIREEVEIFDDECNSLESIDETSSEQSELSQSSEDWLASLEFVRDTEVRQHADECAKEHKKDHPLDYYTPIYLDMEEVPYHAAALVVPEMDPADEKTIYVSTDTLPLGCELDALAAGGVDGCRVVKVLRGGAVERSAALVPGDYITRINSDSLRRVTNADAFRILRKASECTSIEIGYFPGEKVIAHRVKFVRSKSPTVDAENENFYHLNGSRAASSLLEDLPPPELIITTEPLKQLFDESTKPENAWTQTRELKLLKLPGEDTWGLSITGPDIWNSDSDTPSTPIPSLPKEVSQPVFVAGVNENSAAGRCGLLRLGDIIIGVNGMDATRVGSRKVAEWIQTANLVSSNSVSPSDSSSSLENEAEWTFLYLLVLPLHFSNLASSASNSSSISASRPLIDLQSIPPVALTTDSSAPSGEQGKDARPLSYIFNSSSLVRSAFVSSNESSSMEEPTSVASLEQHNDLPEPLGISNLVISPPEEPPLPLPLQPSNDTGGELYTGGPPPPPSKPTDSESVCTTKVASPSATKQPIPSVQTIESQSAWRNIGSSHLSASLAQLTQTYRRLALADDEIHVVSISLTPLSSGPSGSADKANESSVDCESGLGIRLVGHRDTNSRGVFICSLREGSLADRTPGLQVTDEIVQVNNVCVMGLTHVSAKLLISKETEMARRSDSTDPQIFLVIRHNTAYNASVMAKPAPGTAPTGCGHFLHHSSLRPFSQEAPCSAKGSILRSSRRTDYDFFDVTIDRNTQGGLGLFLVNMNPQGDMGVFVQSVLPTSPAGMSGQVRSWDRIVAINGEDVAEYDEAFAKLSACHPAAHLRLARAKPHSLARGTGAGTSVGVNLPRSFSPYDCPTPILLGVETTIEIIRSAEDLGFAIVGGTDSQLGGVFIEKIHRGGTIYKDGRLQPRDRIIAVNDIDLRSVTHAAATKALRETKDRLLLTILRGSGALPFSLSEVLQTYNVALQKQPGTTFGLTLDDHQSGGVVIVNIAAGSPASRASVLHPGDVILEIDGLDVHKASSQDVKAILKQCSTHVLLKTGRLKPSGQPTVPRLRLFTVMLTSPTKGSGSQKEPEISVSASALRVFKRQAAPNPESSSIFGLFFRRALDYETAYVPGNLIIESIQPETAAARCGMLQVGDRLLGIDREPVGWLSIEDLRQFSRHFESLTFDFGRLPPYRSPKVFVQVDNPDISPAPSPRALATVKEAEEVSPIKPLSVAVENAPTPAKPPSPIENPPVTIPRFKNDDGSDGEEAEDSSNFRLRQIQLILPSKSDADPKLGLSLQAIRGSNSGQRVAALVPGSAAAASGLKVGDRIIGFEDRLLFALGRDSETIARSIESTWRSHLDEPLTLTVVRDVPRQSSAATVTPPVIIAKPKDNFPKFKYVLGAAATGVGLMAARQHIRNQASNRLPQDVGDSFDAQLQAGPPGLLLPAVAAGVAAGVYRGVVDDYTGQPCFNSSSESPYPPPIAVPEISEPPFDNANPDDHENIEDAQPPPAEYATANQNNGDEVLEGEYFYDNPVDDDYYYAKTRSQGQVMDFECNFPDSVNRVDNLMMITNANGRSNMARINAASSSRGLMTNCLGRSPNARHHQQQDEIRLNKPPKRRASVQTAPIGLQHLNSPHVIIDDDLVRGYDTDLFEQPDTDFGNNAGAEEPAFNGEQS